MPETDRPATPVVIKKYANRRLYDTESSIYITLDSLAAMVRQGRDFVVFDAKTGDDITRSVLTQIIVEEETKGRNMLPTVFLRQLIGLYGDSMQGMVPHYLEQMMEQFTVQQHAARTASQKPAKPAPEPAARQSVPIIERAKSLLTPFYRPGGATKEEPADELAVAAHSAIEAAHVAEIRGLHAEIEQLRRELAARPQGVVVPPVVTPGGEPSGGDVPDTETARTRP